MSLDPDRRRLLKLLGAGSVTSLAGCGGQQQTTPTEGGQGGTTETTTSGSDEMTETATETEAEPATKPVGGEYITGTTSEARSIHPWDIGDEATGNRLSLLYDAGATINDDIEVESRWFKTWELSDSADVVEYELWDNLQWGGEYDQLTAEDYIYNINTAFQVDKNWSGYQYVDQFFIEGEPIKFEKTGKLSMRAELPKPRANWMHTDPMMYVIPVPKDLLSKYAPGEGGGSGGDLKAFKKDPAITNGVLAGNLGAYSFESWTRNSKMVLARNEDYYLKEKMDKYGTPPYFEQHVSQVFDEQTTGYSALKAGDIDSMGIEARKEPQFQDAQGINLWHSKFGSGIFWLNLNHRINGWAPIRRSRKVRQAFAHLFDKQTLIKQVFQGNANPVDTLHPRWGPYYDDSQIFVPETSVEKAKQKFADGTSSDYGYDGDTFVGPDGEQVELTLVFRAGSQSNEIVSNFVKQQLSKAGIAVKLTSTEWSNLLRNYAQNSAKNVDNVKKADWSVGGFNGGPYDQATSKEPWDLMYGLGFSHGAYAPWDVLKLTMVPKGSFNMWGYTPDFDIKKAANNAQSASSQEKATEILAEVFGFLSKDQPLIWSFNDHTIVGYRNKVGGLPKVKNAFSSPDSARELYFKSQ
ncbi:MAG: ABC transporter substrate-binding protein [Halobacteriales archaeon]|nr:ABC transporter substrate-binding protein [Halobacteriales archaeon]